MYNFPEIRSALDAFWSGFVVHLKKEGVKNIPAKLTHGISVQDLWNDPDLLLTQCCGYDLIGRYKDVLVPVAVPHFSAPGCLGSEYSSFVVVRDDNPVGDIMEMRGSIAVINGAESHSGMSALRHLVTSHSSQGQFFSEVKISGSHIESIHFVKRGIADLGSIDCVTYALLEKHQPQTVWGIRILGRTFYAPAPPYVIRKSDEYQLAERLWNALSQTYNDPALQSIRQKLLLKDVERVSMENYEKIRAFKDHATDAGYPVLV